MTILDPGPRQIAYSLQGPADAPVLVLSNSLGTTMSMWDAQAEALAREFRVLRYDTRGHGASGLADVAAGYTLEQLGGDVLRLLDGLGIERASFCGISMGGLTGQWLGIHAPKRFNKLVLANTAARIGNAEGWSMRAAQVRESGMAAIADGAPARWFTEGFIARAPDMVARMLRTLRAQDAQGYAACCNALAEADLRGEVPNVAVPTLIIAGEHDPVTTVADAEWLRERIPDARLITVPASHISNIEAEKEFTAALRDFLRA